MPPKPAGASSAPQEQVTWRNDRAGIIAKSRKFLEPGEVVAHVVRGLEGPKRWIAIVIGLVIGFGVGLWIPLFGPVAFALVYTRMYARRVILATDRSLVVIGAGRWRFTPKVLLDRLDLETRIAPKGLWLETNLGGRRIYVVARTVGEAQAADADLDDD